MAARVEVKAGSWRLGSKDNARELEAETQELRGGWLAEAHELNTEARELNTGHYIVWDGWYGFEVFLVFL